MSPKRKSVEVERSVKKVRPITDDARPITDDARPITDDAPPAKDKAPVDKAVDLKQSDISHSSCDGEEGLQMPAEVPIGDDSKDSITRLPLEPLSENITRTSEVTCTIRWHETVIKPRPMFSGGRVFRRSISGDPDENVLRYPPEVYEWAKDSRPRPFKCQKCEKPFCRSEFFEPKPGATCIGSIYYCDDCGGGPDGPLAKE